MNDELINYLIQVLKLIAYDEIGKKKLVWYTSVVNLPHYMILGISGTIYYCKINQ